jgi:hypothetical protein
VFGRWYCGGLILLGGAAPLLPTNVPVIVVAIPLHLHVWCPPYRLMCLIVSPLEWLLSQFSCILIRNVYLKKMLSLHLDSVGLC